MTVTIHCAKHWHLHCDAVCCCLRCSLGITCAALLLGSAVLFTKQQTSRCFSGKFCITSFNTSSGREHSSDTGAGKVAEGGTVSHGARAWMDIVGIETRVRRFHLDAYDIQIP